MTGQLLRTRPPYTNADLLRFFKPEQDGTFRVVVVGNGPLYESDRVIINRSNNIVRFNDLNNHRNGEPTSLRAVHYPGAKTPKTNCTAPIWGLSPTPSYIPENVSLYTWTYEPALSHPHIAQIEHFFFPVSQVLEPWQSTVQMFEGCKKCGLACYNNQTSGGPSAGAVVLSELYALERVQDIHVFGMNWGGGIEHNDFKFPWLISTCCTKCKINPTPSSKYGDGSLHFTEDVRNLVVSGSAGGVSLVAAGVTAVIFATHHTHKTVKKHLKRRAERIGREKSKEQEASDEGVRARAPLLALPLTDQQFH